MRKAIQVKQPAAGLEEAVVVTKKFTTYRFGGMTVKRVINWQQFKVGRKYIRLPYEG
jgi:hypothetical protein